MAIEFEKGSKVLSEGRHAATLEEVEEALVDSFPESHTRRPLFARWLGVREAIRRVVPVEREWVDGSYVTQKLDPNDIDMVSHIPGEKLDALDAADQTLLLGLVSGDASQHLHHCDSYRMAVYPPDHPNHSIYKEAYRYWDDWWCHDRDGEPKGYLELMS